MILVDTDLAGLETHVHCRAIGLERAYDFSLEVLNRSNPLLF